MSKTSVALVRGKFREGTKVRLTKLVPSVPENTIGIVDFVDDAGVIFVETPGKLPNFAFRMKDFGKSFVLA